MEERDNTHEHNVFVYGSLKKGEGNHMIMRAAGGVFLGTNQIQAEKVKTQYPFPAVREGLGLVDGEVYAVTKLGLRQLDLFEGHPRFYERRATKTVDGLPVSVYYGTGVFDDHLDER